MWLFTSVRPDVYRQGTPLDEALAAPGIVALIWPLICVNPIMSLQIRLAVKSLRQDRVSNPAPSKLPSETDDSWDEHPHTFGQPSQLHLNGRVVGSFSTSSKSSIMGDVRDPGSFFWRSRIGARDGLGGSAAHVLYL